MFKFLKRSKAVIKEKDVAFNVQYCAVVNNNWKWFSTKDEMLKFLVDYSKVNIIYSLTMFRNEMYECKKETEK